MINDEWATVAQGFAFIDEFVRFIREIYVLMINEILLNDK